MLTRCILGSERLAVSRPGRDATSRNPLDLLLNIDIRNGQILEMGLISLKIELDRNNYFSKATGRYTYQTTYSTRPDVWVRGIENGEILFPPLAGGNAKWYATVDVANSSADVTLGTGGAVNANTRPSQALVMLIRRAL